MKQTFTLSELMTMHAATQTSLMHLTTAAEQYIERVGTEAYTALLTSHRSAIGKIEQGVKAVSDMEGRQRGAGNN